MMRKIHILASILLSAALPASTWSQTSGEERTVHNLRATITGNQEQPKVLYIVPWKAAYDDVAVPYRPISGHIEQKFRHIERREHRRQVEFLKEFASQEN